MVILIKIEDENIFIKLQDLNIKNLLLSRENVLKGLLKSPIFKFVLCDRVFSLCK